MDNNTEGQKRYSPLDNVFHEIFGYYTSKAGEAMEKLTDAAYQVAKSILVKHNQFLPSQYSNTKYQLDGLAETEDGKKQMIEAKDYTINGKKVGRGDLQKQEGALTDLPMEKGVFASATDYTSDAKDYAKGTQINPRQVPIELYHVRPSTIEDEKGRIKTIEVKMCARGLNFEKANWRILWNKESLELIEKRYPEGKKLRICVEYFYNKQGEIIRSIQNLSTELLKQVKLGDHSQTYIDGIIDLAGHYIEIEGQFYLIDGLKYNIPIYNEEMTFTVSADGKPKILIKSEDGKTNKLITDEDIKKVLGKDGKGK